jgi:hypothetical protein
MRNCWLGLVKLKMIHRSVGTILLPDVIVVGKGEHWAQPLFVMPPTLAFLDGDAIVRVPLAVIDPTHRNPQGLDCRVEFSCRDLVASLPDRSQVYRCRIFTDQKPSELSIGRALLRPDGGVNLRVFHHTTDSALGSIRSSGHVRGSPWNYQGTRQLTNVAYAYFTSLPRISSEAELQRIAMASGGKLAFRLDTNHGPTPDLVLDVYRASTRDRQARLKLWVPAEVISTPHIWQHAGHAVYYEVVHPWTFRVGLNPGQNLEFAGAEATPDPASLRGFDYAVLGDCTNVAGLRAPFDEENTTQTFAIQDLAGADICTFWKANANTPLFADPTDTQSFGP